MVTPLIVYEIKEQDAFIAITPMLPQVMQLIITYCAPLFTSELQFKRYVVNNLKTDGTEIFITHLRNPNSNAVTSEIVQLKDDIVVTDEVQKLLGLDMASNSFENSLIQSLNYLYIQHPKDLNIKIGHSNHQPKNPYDKICSQDPSLFDGGEQKGFKWQLLKPSRFDLQGILLYRGNMFVRRLFDQDSYLGKRSSSRSSSAASFLQNGIVAVSKK